MKVGVHPQSRGGRLYDEEFGGKHGGALDICTPAVDCSVRSLWQVIQQAVDCVVDNLTLADMLDEQKANTRAGDRSVWSDPERRALTLERHRAARSRRKTA